MKIAIDTSPLKTGHRVRGVGQYTRCLMESLPRYDRGNKYLFFNDGKVPAEAEVVHYPYFHPYSLTLPRVFLCPTVVTVHDLIPLVFPEAYPPGVRGKISFLIQKKRLWKVACVVTDSVTSAADVIRFYGLPKAKIVAVSLAAGEVFTVLPRHSRTLILARKKFALPERFVLYVGDVNYNKDLPRLVQACRSVQLPLVMVGKQAAGTDFDADHPENHDLAWLREQVAKKTILPGGEMLVRTLGFVSDTELNCLYNLSSVYCQPSRYEGFGLPVLEAMACGTPVVAAANSSLVEIIGRAGILVDRAGPEALGAALKRVVEDDALAGQLAARGLERAGKYTWQKTALQMKEVYEKVGQKKD